MLDVTTEWGQHAEQRLRTNIIGWLTTVGSDRCPNRCCRLLSWNSGHSHEIQKLGLTEARVGTCHLMQSSATLQGCFAQTIMLAEKGRH
jgi:hypothetical protein